ncbi:hypothetical protein PQX77_020239 [Marasmius sp. AFHP31]|nr:hypothetical protein PQX77_020239 [Marasmius sp. AFHP31]
MATIDREKLLLKGIVLTQKQTIENLQRESNQLRAALRVFTDESSNTKPVGDETVYFEASEDTDIEMIVESLNFSDVGAISGTQGQSGDGEVLTAGHDEKERDEFASDGTGEEEEDGVAPIWSKEDDLYRCALCNWEIVERECQGCWYDYSNYVYINSQCSALPQDCEFDPIDGDKLDQSDTTFHLQNDDYLFPTNRSSTPVLTVNPARLRPDTVAYGYESRTTEYKSLLERGATRPMCETFSLSYSSDSGIIFNMTDNDDLFDTWAGEAILAKECLSWKVSLGREIRLDPEDLDGSVYIEDFLEEALLYSTERLEEPGSIYWVTREVKWGHWETRAVLSTSGEEEEQRLSIAEPSRPVQDAVPKNTSVTEWLSSSEAPADPEHPDDNDNLYGSESSLDSEAELPVGKNDYESDGIDDESLPPGSDESDGFESDREDKYWGPPEGGYKYAGSDSEDDEGEDYQSDYDGTVEYLREQFAGREGDEQVIS